MQSKTIRHVLSAAGLSLAFVLAPTVVGCDKTVSKEATTVKKSDGTSTSQEKTVTQSPDGTVKEKTTEKSKNP
jgi:hypothetical protein